MASILDLPYNVRRFIRVDGKALPVSKLGHNSSDASGAVGVGIKVISSGALAGSVAAVGPLALLAVPVILGVQYFARNWAGSPTGAGHLSKNEDLIIDVTAQEISTIAFPIGHPLKNTVYAGHPAVSNLYYPLSDFHKALFVQKYMEAVKLLRSLGAGQIEISSVTGWSKDWAASAGVPFP